LAYLFRLELWAYLYVHVYVKRPTKKRLKKKNYTNKKLFDFFQFYSPCSSTSQYFRSCFFTAIKSLNHVFTVHS
jgi:hypothetical protein